MRDWRVNRDDREKPKRRRTVRVPKPVLAMAAPISEHPVVSIERLKDGTLNWSIRVPGASLRKARERALVEAKLLQAELDAWQRQRARGEARALFHARMEKEAADRKRIDDNRVAIDTAQTLHEIGRGFKP